MIKQYEKEYQEAKAEYEQAKAELEKARLQFWEACNNLNGTKSADNQNKSRYGFW